MNVFEIIILALYTLILALIFIYAVVQLNLLINYLKERTKQKNIPKLVYDSNTENLPIVTIQLPVYNELYVMERLLDNIANINYPREKLDIQVLDDSTDESIELTATLVAKLKLTGLNIHHICREIRTGFKAGALKEGLETAKGEFIAIFDADFLPQPDWLYQTLPYFSSPNIGLVQTAWGHINRNYSMLTKAQALGLDAHFTIEQVGRNSQGHYMNFNGTAGIWRKECILDAGNWQADTLTEDLDLSYRAQLKNWKFKYLEHVKTPAELPIVMSAAKSQQFRWNKGGAQTFQKTAWRMLNKKGLPFATKIHSLTHLLNSSIFLLILILSVLSIPILYIKNKYGFLKPYFLLMGFFVISTLIFILFYWIAYRREHGRGVKSFATYIGSFLSFFSIAMGFSLYNSIAVLEGHLGKKSDFIRTPKFNASDQTVNLKANKYMKRSIPLHVILEGLLFVYFVFGVVSAFLVGGRFGDFTLLPFHLMLAFGFGFVFFTSVFAKSAR